MPLLIRRSGAGGFALEANDQRNLAHLGDRIRPLARATDNKTKVAQVVLLEANDQRNLAHCYRPDDRVVVGDRSETGVVYSPAIDRLDVDFENDVELAYAVQIESIHDDGRALR